MGNIDCDQIILFGLVAMFSIYFYRNILEPNNMQNFSIGGQNTDLATEAADAAASDADNSAASANTAANAANAAIKAANAANAANNAANNANAVALANANVVANAVVNANAANAANNVATNVATNVANVISNTPEPSSDMDSVPQNYKTGNINDSCLPQDVLSSVDLLPKEDKEAILQFTEDDNISDGILKGVNFLNAGFHIGVNSVGQSLRNGNQQIRSEPPNPQTQVSPWQNTTISPDLQRRPLELTESCAKSQNNTNTPEVPGRYTGGGASVNASNN
tara:strand:+ start:320 stop:1159 length:840 start_codon:yes stop_codon:yes gene_type:complete